MKENIQKKKVHEKLKSYRNMFLVFLLLCLLTFIFSFQYYKKLHYTIREESKSYLKEVTSQIGSNIDRMISDNYAALYMMESVLEYTTMDSFADVFPMLEEQSIHWDFESIMVVDEAGKAYDLENREVFLTIDDSMRADILNQEKTMSTTQIVNNQEYIIIAIPLKNVELDGKKMIALAGSYHPVSFEKVLSMTSFEEQAYSQIITKSGSVVTRPSMDDAIKTGYNVFSTIGQAKLDADCSLDEMKTDIDNDVASQIGFTLDGVHRYMIYTPIQPEEWYLVTFVPSKVVNQRSDLLLRSTLIICGLIAFIFIVLMSIIFYIMKIHRRKLEQIAYVDEVTGGNTIQRFYQIVRNILDNSSDNSYVLVYTNIEKFKILNEQLGREKCDGILKSFHNFITVQLTGEECIGRLFADNFCILLRYTDKNTLLQRLDDWNNKAEAYAKEGRSFEDIPFTQFGIYLITENTLSFPQMIDRAKLALGVGSRDAGKKLDYVFYNDDVRKTMFREKQLEDRMERALLNNEFQVYLQPKFHLPEERILGAEALVRWESPEDGLIFPNEFIPLFEKNGFIVRLDLWVFESVCKTMRSWIDNGISPIKISVNCSRVHLKYQNFVNSYIEIAKRYQLDKNLIEMELTESMVLENDIGLLKIIREIKDVGFGCSMDDFGSGYSSLNLIQSIPVDTLKLDKIFFDKDESEFLRTEAVVKSIISLASALGMETVAEGVEHRHQVEMLKKVGCGYVQGYVFAKPMKIKDFEQLAFNQENK